jgi:xylose dehydrogenase (NAD/NADP)
MKLKLIGHFISEPIQIYLFHELLFSGGFMEKTLNWGIISTAKISERLITAMQFTNISGFRAVASRSIDSARNFSNKYGIPVAYGRYEDLLDDPRIDVVYIPLPNHLHAEWVIKAVNAGKHVLCEKPLALFLDDIRNIKIAAQSAGKVVAEAFMYRHHPQTLDIQELINSGIIGEVKFLHASFCFFLKSAANIRRIKDYGGGCLWDVGCYPVSLSRIALSNTPKLAWGNQILGGTGIDEVFCGQLVFPGNAIAQIDSSFQTQNSTYAEIHGTDGTLIIPDAFKMGPQSCITLKHGSHEKIITYLTDNLYLGEVIDMEQAILSQKTPRISLDDSLENIRTILALYESARSGKPVLT